MSSVIALALLGQLHALSAAGGAAGLAAAFNAPLSGAIFVIEEMRLQFRFGFVSFQAVLVAAVTSDIVTRAALGQGPQLSLAAYDAPALAHLPLFLLFGALLGALGVLFSRCILGGVARLAALPTRAHLALAALVGALVGALSQWDAALVGGGYETIREAMTMRAEVAALLGLAALRFLLTVTSFGTGVPGGIFAPMLALGSLIGLAFGVSCHEWGLEEAPLPGVFAVAGMAAFFASVVRAPITGIMLTLELTGDFGLVLAILATCLASTLTAERLGGQPIYELLLERSLARRASAGDGPSARGAAED